MTVIYVNANSGSDSNPGTSQSAPKATYASARAALGNGQHDICLARGQEHRVTSELYPRAGSAADAPFRIIPYGDGAKPRVVPGWAPGSSTSLCNPLTNQNYWRIEDIVFDAKNLANFGGAVGMSINSTAQIVSGMLLRCEFTGAVNGFSCGYTSVANAAGSIVNSMLRGCMAYGNARHGYYFNGATDLVVLRCIAYGNGIGDGGHGFSAQGAARSVYTSGWTLESGTTYSRAEANETWGVFTDVQAYRALKKNTATPTAPAAGEYGWASGTLYVNFAQNPAGASVTVCAGRNSIILMGCEAYENRSFYPYAFEEGAGFQFDDYTSFCQMIRCLSRDNDGAGFGCNNVADSTYSGNIALRNAKLGFGATASRNVLFEQLTMADNNRGATRWPYSSGVAINPSANEADFAISPGCTVRNVAIRGRGKSGGINIDTISNSGMTVSSVRAQGVTSLFPGQTPAGSDRSLASVLLSEDGKPLADSPCLPQYDATGAYVASTGGTDLGWRRDRDGKQCRRVIGAYGAAVMRQPA